MGKLGLLLALAVAGIVVVVTRFILKRIAQTSAFGAINRIRKNHAYAQRVADELDIPVARREAISEADFHHLRSYLQEGRVIGNYRILFATELNPGEFLVFTEISITDFAATVTGKPGDVNKTDYYNFVFAHDASSRVLTVRSDLFNDTNEKFLKEGFLNAVFKGKVA